MRVVLFHPVLLPPLNYGGVERVVLWLAQGLRERGHEVWIAADSQSRLPKGIHLLPMEEGKKSALDLLRKLPGGTDVVHFMAPPEKDVWSLLPCAGIVTVHGNGKPNEIFPVNSVFLSQDHAVRHGAEVFVYNGIDPEECLFERGGTRRGFLFLSKTSWKVKNLRGAMRICTRARVDLLIAGGNRPVLPRLVAFLRPSMHWLGPVAGEKKARALLGARALLFPVTWPEPFGLVVVEALMSGTPVIASKKGSLPELVPPDVGILLDPPVSLEAETAWVDFLESSQEKMDSWNPERCREWALEKFQYSRMAQGYEALYNRVIHGETLHQLNPIAGNWRDQ